MKYLLLALLLAGCANADTLEPSPAASPAAVVAAERAFAARAGEVGWIPAFREFTAPDGMMVGPNGLTSSTETLAALADDGERNLYWAPLYAGVSRSGDLGFTTGPASFDAERTPRIQYFTIWRQQPDGSWKWIYDGGPGPVTEPGPYLAAGQEPAALPIAAAGTGSAETAVAQVSAIERAAPNAAALVGRLAPDAHVYRTGRPRAYGGEAAATTMALPNASVAYNLERAEASSAGDLVVTLGDAAWTREDGSARQGVFARVWQYRNGGWVIVYDQLVGRPPPPAPPPPGN